MQVKEEHVLTRKHDFGDLAEGCSENAESQKP